MKRILLILLAALLSAGILYNSYQAAQREAYLKEYQDAVQELETKRQRLEEQLVVLQRNQNTARDCGMGILLFEKPSERLYTEVLPIMQEYELTGVVVLRAQEYPGQPGCITVEQMQEMAEAGWIFCAGWDGKEELEGLREPFKTLKLPKSKAAWMQPDTFQPEQTETMLKGAGYATVFNHGEAGSLLPEREISHGVRQIGICLWNDPAILLWLDKAVEDCGLLAIGVDFETEYGDFNGELFHNMCQILREHSDRFLLANLTDPTEVEQRAAAYNLARQEYLAAEIERYDQQIEQIYTLYAQYGENMEKPSEPQR